MTLKGRKETSGRNRLATLGPVFTAQDLHVRFGWSHGTTQVTLHRWHRRDRLVRPLGGRSEVYFNLLADPNWYAYFEIGLKLAIPHAITVGQSAYSNGWISQPPNARHLAVPTNVQLYKIDGCQFHHRRPGWFQAVSNAVQYNQHTIPELRPGWALADALFTKAAYRSSALRTPRTTDGLEGAHSFVPDPDELYADECTPHDLRDFTEAVAHLQTFYGFSQLLTDETWTSMRAAYASVHALILGAFSWENSATPGL